MNISRSLATIGAAGAFALVVPAGFAHADTVQPRATGTFTYYNVLGQQTITNPADDACLATVGTALAGPVTNATGDYAIEYRLPNCLGPGFPVPPGATIDSPIGFTSVLFIPVP